MLGSSSASPQVRAWHAEERARRIIESVRDYAIFMLDPSGRVESWNPGAEAIKGYRADEILGRHFSVFYTEADRAAGLPDQALATAAREGRCEQEGWRVRKDGSLFFADAVITPLRSSSGRLEGFAKVTRDLTARRELEAERLRLAGADALARQRDELVGMAAHELRTPLTAVLLELESLERSPPPREDELRLRLARVRRSAERLSDQVNDLLEASRIYGHGYTAVVEPVDLVAVTAGVVEAFRGRARRAGCELTLEAGEPVGGRLDQRGLKEVVGALLSNAIKFGAGAPVEVEVFREGDAAVLAVRDHGPGVPAEARTRIFELFERATPASGHGGLGLGLYLASEVVRSLGGRFDVADATGGGARFTVRLPLHEPVRGA
jgi:PAS domain S-box-containing protein